MKNRYSIMYCGEDLQEMEIKRYSSLAQAQNVLMRFARIHGMRFKRNSWLFGGYYVQPESGCAYYIK